MYCTKCGNPIEYGDHFCRSCGNPLSAVNAVKKGSLWIPIGIMILLCGLGIGLFFALPYGSGSADFPTAETLNCFTVEDGILFFDQTNYFGSGELIVPEYVGGKKVTGLSDGCFENCARLISVELPDTIETIGSSAFRGCTALRGIEIPESVDRIEAEAFWGCNALEAICLGNTLDHIGHDTFSECNQLYFIFFTGEYQDWTELYDEFINPYATVYYNDGSFFQGKPAN